MTAHFRRHMSLLRAAIVSRTAAQAGLVLAGNTTSGVLRLVISFVLAGALSKTDWGRLFVFITLMDMLGVFFDLGLNGTMVRFMAAHAGAHPGPIVRRALGIKLALTAAVALAAWAARPWFLDAQTVPAQLHWLYAAAVGAAACLGLNAFVLGLLQGRERYRFYALTSVSINVIRAACLGLLLWGGVRTLTPLAQAFFAAPVLNLLLAAAAAALAMRGLRDRTPAQIQTGALLRFMAPLALMMGVLIVTQRADVLLLNALSTPEEVSRYGVAYQMAFVLPLVSSAVFTVLLPKVSGLTARADLRTYRRRVLMFVPAVLAGALAYGLAGPLFIRWTLGEKYADAAVLVLLLSIAFGLYAVYNPLGLVFYALGRPSVVTCISTAQLVLLAALNLALVPRWGAVGTAIAAIVCRLAAVLLMAWITHRRLAGEEESHE